MLKAPSSAEEYQERYERNLRTTGLGERQVTHYPCPFCAASDWLEASDISLGSSPVLCLACGRSAQVLRQAQGRSGVPELELVQIDGPAAPEWMEAPPRRVREQVDSIDPNAHAASGAGHLSPPPASSPKLREGAVRRRY